MVICSGDPIHQSQTLRKVQYKLKFNYYCESEKRYFLHNAFSIYWKHDLEKFPFDERLSGKEDRYWAKDRIKEGYRVLYNPELVCKHNYTIEGATWKGVG